VIIHAPPSGPRPAPASVLASLPFVAFLSNKSSGSLPYQALFLASLPFVAFLSNSFSAKSSGSLPYPASSPFRIPLFPHAIFGFAFLPSPASFSGFTHLAFFLFAHKCHCCH
jgi:hypothetical protein